MICNRSDFGDNFYWGVSTSSYQIEGAHNVGDKAPSIWDAFSNKRGRIYQNQNGNQSCDFYHRYKEDISLMKEMSIPNFRFSISWSRILPDGVTHLSKNGIDYYNRVIDYCLEVGITPWITLYHWDLPVSLEKKGGWTNRQIVSWFSAYVSLCISTFGDRVKHWMILNEPLVFTGAGYFFGVHAPGRKGLNNFLAAAHHAALCQAEGGRVARSLRTDLKIGTTFSCSLVHPGSYSTSDIAAAARVDALLNRMFLEPLLGLGYPSKDLKLLQRMEPFIKDGDEGRLAFEADFIGIQNYTREVVASSIFTPLLKAKILKASTRKVERTEMNWEIFPSSIFCMLKQFGSYKQVKELIITENGAAFNDIIHNDQVHDVRRRKYLQDYIAQVLLAKRSGIPVNGYFVWSFTDNFEWAEGYRPRFGLVYIDYANQRRIIKSSGIWYKQFLQNKLNSLIAV